MNKTDDRILSDTEFFFYVEKLTSFFMDINFYFMAGGSELPAEKYLELIKKHMLNVPLETKSEDDKQ